MLMSQDLSLIQVNATSYFAGVAVFERATHWVEQKLNEVATRFSSGEAHELELHGSPMRSGKSDRLRGIRDALRMGVAEFYPRSVRVFASVIEKAAVAGQDPIELGFEQLSSRFDQFLQRQYSKHNNPQRGIMIFDRSSTEQRIQTLAREFKYRGHTWGKTRNYAEVPLFLDSRATRLIQLADLVAFAIYRNFEHGDPTFFQEIEKTFDAEGGVQHGLFIKSTLKNQLALDLDC